MAKVKTLTWKRGQQLEGKESLYQLCCPLSLASLLSLIHPIPYICILLCTLLSFTFLFLPLQIVVDRSVHTYETAFIILGSAFLLINNINMGAQLDIGIIREVLRRPLGPACGFISQFAVMPLVREKARVVVVGLGGCGK